MSYTLHVLYADRRDTVSVEKPDINRLTDFSDNIISFHFEPKSRQPEIFIGRRYYFGLYKTIDEFLTMADETTCLGETRIKRLQEDFRKSGFVGLAYHEQLDHFSFLTSLDVVLNNPEERTVVWPVPARN